MRTYNKRLLPHERQDAERVWHIRGQIWRCLAAHPEGLRPTDVVKLTGLTYNVVHHALNGTKHITGYVPGMSGVRKEGNLYFATGVTEEWARMLGVHMQDFHGTYARYTKALCRCELCITAKDNYQRDWLDKKRVL
jgi:hypothetical protein